MSAYRRVSKSENSVCNGSIVPCQSVGDQSVVRSDVNPFIHPLKFSALDKLRIALMTITFLPFRAVIGFLSLLLCWFFITISLIGWSQTEHHKPFPRWRNWLRPLAVLGGRGLFFFGGYHWVTVKGKRASADQAPVLAVAPHSSYMDALVLDHLNLPSIVAKNSMIEIPIFGTIFKYMQPVLVERENPLSRQNTVKEVRRRAAAAGTWPQIVIFPEGTCTNRSCLISFKAGAFIPGVPVQPVCVKYTNKRDITTWTWGGIGVLKTLWYTFSSIHNGIEIEFLPVYRPSEEEKNDASLFARNVRAVMAIALNVPVTEHSYEDGEVLYRITKLGLRPSASTLVNAHLLFRTSNVSIDLPSIANIAEELIQYVSFNFTKSEFTKILLQHLPDAVCMQLYPIYAQNDLVDMRMVVVDLLFLTHPKTADDVLKCMFNLYDRQASGKLSLCEVDSLLKFCCLKHPSTVALSHYKHFTYDDVQQLAELLGVKFAELSGENGPRFLNSAEDVLRNGLICNNGIRVWALRWYHDGDLE